MFWQVVSFKRINASYTFYQRSEIRFNHGRVFNIKHCSQLTLTSN